MMATTLLYMLGISNGTAGKIEIPLIPCVLSSAGERVGVSFGVSGNLDYSIGSNKTSELVIPCINGDAVKVNLTGLTFKGNRIGSGQNVNKILGWKFIKQHSLKICRRTGRVDVIKDADIPSGYLRYKVYDYKGFPMLNIGDKPAFITNISLNSYNLSQSDDVVFQLKEKNSAKEHAGKDVRISLVPNGQNDVFPIVSVIFGGDQFPTFSTYSVGSDVFYFDSKNQEIVFVNRYKYPIQAYLSWRGIFFDLEKESDRLENSPYFGLWLKGVTSGATVKTINRRPFEFWKNQNWNQCFALLSSERITELEFESPDGNAITVSLETQVLELRQNK